jgi:two-component system response regulator FixJ
LQDELTRRGLGLPVLLITGHGDVPSTVRAMKGGAIDFLEKPVSESALFEGIGRAFCATASSTTRAGSTSC